MGGFAGQFGAQPFGSQFQTSATMPMPGQVTRLGKK